MSYVTLMILIIYKLCFNKQVKWKKKQSSSDKYLQIFFLISTFFNIRIRNTDSDSNHHASSDVQKVLLLILNSNLMRDFAVCPYHSFSILTQQPSHLASLQCKECKESKAITYMTMNY